MREHEDLFCCGRSAYGARRAGAGMSGKFARPGSKPSYAPDRDFDTRHIFLEINVDMRKKALRGVCSTTFTAIIDGAKEIHFDAVGLSVLAVHLPSGKKLRYSYKGSRLVVFLPGPLKESDLVTVVIKYSVTNPAAGVYFVGPDKQYPKKPVQVWTHGEAEETRYWFPCFDAPHDKATTEMAATVPADFFALSNGGLVDVRENRREKTKTYHWKQEIPHSPYLVSLVAGRFSEIKDEWDGVPVLYYCRPGREQDAKRAFGKTPKMVQFFSEKTGVRYPYEKYAQIAVSDFLMGGMEHTTATTQTDRVLMDERAYPEFRADWLVSHELAHQWFGDLLTCKDWSHAWLNESFATYFEGLFTQYDLGEDEFQFEMYEKLAAYLDEDKNVYRRPIVTNVYRDPNDLFDRHLYEKGSLALHMLRHFLGDCLFWKAIRRYTQDYQEKAVETNDLINAIQDATGKNTRAIFDQFIYGSGHPEYTVHYWWDIAAKTARVQVVQKPIKNGAYFSVPVELEFIIRGGKKVFTETISGKTHKFDYRFAEEPEDLRFDPARGILKTAEVFKPYKMWVKQIESDTNCVGRLLAAKEIAKVKTDESLRVLVRAFHREKFWAAAKEIALAIGSICSEDARKFLLESIKTKNPKVRRGVVEALAKFRDRETAKALERVFDGDKSYFVSAEALKSLAEAMPVEAVKSINKALKRDSWNDTYRSTAVACLAKTPGKNALGLLRKFSGYGMHPAARASAVQALSRCAKSYPELFSDLIFLTGDPQERISQAAITALGNLKDPRAVSSLEKIHKDKKLPPRLRACAEDALLKINPV